jgi:predicted O-methyltransferase YrrM
MAMDPTSQPIGVPGSVVAVVARGAAALDGYRGELAETGVLDLIARAEAEFGRTVSGVTVRGSEYAFGGMREEASVRLYGLVRAAAPAIAVETGVCNGSSTAVILAALERNGRGVLHSLDYPEVAGTAYPVAAFWAGKKGAVVPAGREPGWLVPAHLRQRWTLTIGRSQDALGPLLRRLGGIDFFLHDSEHSRECMRFEYDAAWRHLEPGGVLLSDDVTWNDEFDRFCGDAGRPAIPLTRNMAFAVR